MLSLTIISSLHWGGLILRSENHATLSKITVSYLKVEKVNLVEEKQASKFRMLFKLESIAVLSSHSDKHIVCIQL